MLIKADDYPNTDFLAQTVKRIDFPKTYTHLVLEHDGAFNYVSTEDIDEWGLSENELIEIGIANTPGNEIKAVGYSLGDEYSGYTFLSGDYSLIR